MKSRSPDATLPRDVPDPDDAEAVARFTLAMAGEHIIRLRCIEGLWVGVSPRLFTWALVYGVSEGGIVGRYCYDDLGEALAAFDQLFGQVGVFRPGWHPAGPWVKHAALGIKDQRGPGADPEPLPYGVVQAQPGNRRVGEADPRIEAAKLSHE